MVTPLAREINVSVVQIREWRDNGLCHFNKPAPELATTAGRQVVDHEDRLSGLEQALLTVPPPGDYRIISPAVRTTALPSRPLR